MLVYVMDNFLEGYELIVKRPDIAAEAWEQQNSFGPYLYRDLTFDRGMIAGCVAVLFGVSLLSHRSNA